MLSWAFLFLIGALIAAVFGFGGIASTFAGYSETLGLRLFGPISNLHLFLRKHLKSPIKALKVDLNDLVEKGA